MPNAHQKRRILFPLLYAALLGGITLVVSEGALRILLERQLGRPPANAEKSAEHQFWRRDESLGWSNIPGASGHFTNGAFDGDVHFDSLGDRMNSAQGTLVPGYRNIFFLGDSTTASLEVDDDETVPALVEQALRSRGRRVNVINLGVRGYGTDQSVRKALDLARSLPPADIIYMYVENDVWDNNVLREAGRKYGKGVYLRREGETSFTPYHYPVPDEPEDWFGIVVFDNDCRPTLHTGSVERTPRPLDTPRRWVDDHLYLARAFGRLRHAARDPDPASIDPDRMIREQGVLWSGDFSLAYTDAGSIGRRCASYFDAQMRFLLELLRDIPGVEHLYVVHYPDWAVEKNLSEHRSSPRVDEFHSMAHEGFLDGYLDLTESFLHEGESLRNLQCPYDEHFCEQGNRWLAEHIVNFLDSN
jgi:hypothetical protein